ncbi:DUF445 domain-containing protein [Staphylococcus massiliensis]|uniref:Uncharacterized protein n=1 Tax=Staphylococcus massiliensis S46 TaxID=1229783 RepID=K9AVG5_9STAP|nr:DUF445 family protein [Staphylococcus massiliensis]EKU46582.1 hypothetical protein C273_09026 [Staphylococcus massiliensis S46]MCG3399653.1 DUF445 family protein [Staphylococcus massiliensis]MCG3412078.1 DUF445 family protein [Staphylococcus massiliensis]PNZ99317.1 DUF445 domain-containing protein [Staphylococcus massiliensis CCUG 55927]
MKIVLTLLFMMILGSIIGGITNIIAIRMLFHPYKPMYLFGKKLPFTPGLIPKRRGEIATKIGQVIEEHLLTPSLLEEKIQSQEVYDIIHDEIKFQIAKLQKDHVTPQYLGNKFNFDVTTFLHAKSTHFVKDKIETYYETHQNDTLESLLPRVALEEMDTQVDKISPLLRKRVEDYLSSSKGSEDINEMLDTFFLEKGKIVGLLQMFMTREAIAERVQTELIRLTHHPKAIHILNEQIETTYEMIKAKKLGEVVSHEQKSAYTNQLITSLLSKAQLSKFTHRPLNALIPNELAHLESKGSIQLTDTIVQEATNHISTVLAHFDIKSLIETQINRFELDYIEKLIIDIANKELKLITLLGFLLGGIIGLFQGIIAIFV